MRNLVLVALVLQLVLILANGYEFGDLISFQRQCKGILLYKHFAVYVGNMSLPGKKAGQDIFHHTGQPWNKGECVFGVLKETTGVGPVKKENYLDKCCKGQIGTADHRAQMIERIKYWNDKKNCGTYNLLTNNCEHLATHVRYGIKNLRQPGVPTGWFFMNTDECQNLLKAMEEDQERGRNSSCTSSAEKAGTKSLPLLVAIVVPVVVVVVVVVVVYVVYATRIFPTPCMPV